MAYDMDYKHDDPKHDPKGDPSPAPTSDDDIITTTTTDDDVTKIGALADGFANTAINSTEIDDDSTGYVGGLANGDNRNNTDNSTNVDVDVKTDISADNGNNRDNEYDWSYSAKSDDHTDNSTYSDDDSYIKQTTIDDSDSSTDYDWSYYAKSDDHSQVDDHSKVDDHSYSKTTTDTDVTQTTDSHNAENSFNKSDDDFATISGVKDFDNLGVAGRDLTFDIGDDFSFTLNLNDILNGTYGDGNSAAFNVIQTNNLVDQDNAYEFSMNNQHANNQLQATGGDSDGASGMELDGKTWNLSAGDDATGTSTADSSAILANSGFHLELVQGANMLSNAFDTHVSGTDMHTTNVGEDTSGAGA
jgi:hypothetical protein